MRGQANDLARIAEKKQRILEAGFRLFAEAGIESVSMQVIAEKSRVPWTSMYRYYATKLELVIAIGAWKWNEYLAARSTDITQEEKERMTAADFLSWYMDAFLDLYRNHSDILRFNYAFNSFLRNEQASQEQKQPYMNAIEKLRTGFHGLYEKGMKDGTLNPDISEEEMLSSSFHIMLAAVTRYAVGLIYVIEGRTNPEAELVMLKNALLREYIRENGAKVSCAEPEGIDRRPMPG